MVGEQVGVILEGNIRSQLDTLLSQKTIINTTVSQH